MKKIRIEFYNDMGALIDQHYIHSHDNGTILKDEVIEYINSIIIEPGDVIRFVEDEE